MHLKLNSEAQMNIICHDFETKAKYQTFPSSPLYSSATLSHEFFVVIPSDAVHRLSLVYAQSNCTLRFILCGTCHTDQSWSIDGSLRGLHSLPLCLWQLSLTHLLSNELRSLCLSSDADLCRSNAGSCILDESLVCIYPFTPTHPPPSFPSPPSLFLSLPFFWGVTLICMQMGCAPRARYVQSPVLQSGGVGEIVFVFMRHGPCDSWERKCCE